jgi:fatty-acid peroxygenase
MVDGFATAGPRHWRARRARGRQQRALGQLVQRVRAGEQAVPEGSAVAVVAAHRDSDGALLEPRVAAVELLNVIRPTVAVSWFLAFSAHALHRWPHLRVPLRSGDPQAGWAFAHEVRRFYPFVPLLAGKAVTDLEWDGERVPAGGLVLIDVWGQDHDPALWEDPWSFRPERFVGREIGPYELIPQGGGSPVTGHRCPGEDLTIALLQVLVPRLAALDYTVPPQDMDISLRRIPALPRSRMVLADVRVPAAAEPALSAPGS